MYDLLRELVHANEDEMIDGLAVTTEPVPEHDITRIHILAVHSSIRAESLSPMWHT